MNNNPLVSIGLPTYNRTEGLRNALDYFCNQKYENLEIIVSDNCSPDDPTDMVNEFIKKDKRIRYYRQSENIGMSLNVHFIWGKSRGKYFTLASDDDWWSDEFVSELVFLLQKNKDAVCAYGDFWEVDLDGNRIESYPDHYLLLKEFDEPNQIKRLGKFILQKENEGKANVHRAICDRELFFASIQKLYNLGLAGCWAFDQLLAFTFLVEGTLAVSDKLLFKCTVGNEKHYVDTRSRIEYLEGYARVIASSINDKDTSELMNAIDKRYMDNEIGFQQEYLSILRSLYRKSVYANRNQVLKITNDIKQLILQGRHRETVLTVKGFISTIVIPEGFNKIFYLSLFPFRIAVKKIVKEIFGKVSICEKN